MRPDTPGLDHIRTLVTDHHKVAPIARLLNFLAPLTEGPVLGERAVTRKGRSTVFLEAALRDSAGTGYACSSSVGAIRRPVQK